MYRLSVIGFKVRNNLSKSFLTDKINYITVDIYGKLLSS